MLSKNDLKEINNLIKNNLEPVKKDIVKLINNRIRRSENKMISKINWVADYFDEKFSDHENRIQKLEYNSSIQ